MGRFFCPSTRSNAYSVAARSMKLSMRFCRQYQKIFKSVISFVAVKVVNMFRGIKRSPEGLFGNNSVLIHTPLVISERMFRPIDAYIALCVFTASTLPVTSSFSKSNWMSAYKWIREATKTAMLSICSLCNSSKLPTATFTQTLRRFFWCWFVTSFGLPPVFVGEPNVMIGKKSSGIIFMPWLKRDYLLTTALTVIHGFSLAQVWISVKHKRRKLAMRFARR
jgi:hypothetical protein